MSNETNETSESQIKKYKIKPFCFEGFQYSGEFTKEQIDLIKSGGEIVTTISNIYDYTYVGSHLVFKGDYVVKYKDRIMVINEESFDDNFEEIK